MSAVNVAALLQYARLVNGTCGDCGRILPHPDSGKKHECAASVSRVVPPDEETET